MILWRRRVNQSSPVGEGGRKADENKVMAKRTKYATLASIERAVLSEWMMVCRGDLL
jgi:hypothetical protein